MSVDSCHDSDSRSESDAAKPTVKQAHVPIQQRPSSWPSSWHWQDRSKGGVLPRSVVIMTMSIVIIALLSSDSDKKH